VPGISVYHYIIISVHHYISTSLHHYISTSLYHQYIIVFEDPYWLLLLLLIPAAGWWYFSKRKKDQTAIRLSSIAPFDSNLSFKAKAHLYLLPLLRGLALCLLIVALARPQLSYEQEDVKGKGIDIVLVMDVSASMLSQDFEPNRLEVSKKVAARFVEKRIMDRIALVAFSGEAVTKCPLTTDKSVLNQILAGLQCGELEDGTAIGMGLAAGVNRIKESVTASKIIILLTDGVSNKGYIQPLQAAQIAKEFGLRVYTIGVGSEGEALSPIGKRGANDFVYGMVPVEIDEALLTDIATSTGGKYFRAKDKETLVAIYDEIDKLEKSEIKIGVVHHRKDVFFYFIAAALVLLLLEAVLRMSVLKTLT
jgi:Ca-activated chloride channel family protein